MSEAAPAPAIAPAIAPRRRIDQVAMWVGPLVIAGLMMWMSYWTLFDQSRPEIAVVWVMLTSLPYALLWLAAALGLGWPLRRWLLQNDEEGLALQAGFGVAIMLGLDVLLGITGVLQMGGSIGAWVPIGLGLLLIGEQFRRWLTQETRPEVVVSWSIWSISPAVAVLLLAACSAPGWLWTTEFGGYDVLSYHLQLPREWFRAGAISAFDHNVYSHMPSFMEAAYYHLAVLVGDHIEFTYAAQMLHAGITLLAAGVAARVGVLLAGPRAGLATGAIVLGVPWSIVTGSMGYNEMAVVLMLAGAVLLLERKAIIDAKGAVALGLFCGAACGAKLTSCGMVVAPLMVLVFLRQPIRDGAKTIAIGAITLVILLSPWLLSNARDTGNPVFPFATNVLSSGHWTEEQATTWATGHAFEGGVTDRVRAAFNQFLRFGLGANPDETEPWLPQWSALPLLCVLALSFLLPAPAWRKPMTRLALMLLFQVLFWAMFTHVKSRFMLPAVVPMALVVGIALGLMFDRVAARGRAWGADLILSVLLIGWCVQPLVLFSRERSGYPASMADRAGQRSGADLDDATRRDKGLNESIEIYINHALGTGDRVLLVGYATPLYIDRPVTYQTTWDRGPLSEVMREYPDEPARWVDALRARRFTHIYVDPVMLSIWADAGWNDPLITTERVLNTTDLYATEVCRYVGGGRLYQLERSSAPPGSP